jgi:hypothetical protein
MGVELPHGALFSAFPCTVRRDVPYKRLDLIFLPPRTRILDFFSELQALETLNHNFVESFDFLFKLTALKTSVTTLLSQIT